MPSGDSILVILPCKMPSGGSIVLIHPVQMPYGESPELIRSRRVCSGDFLLNSCIERLPVKGSADAILQEEMAQKS